MDRADDESEASALSERLIAGRFGELAHLRALVDVEKTRSSLASLFEQRLAPRAHPGCDAAAGSEETAPPARPSSAQAAQVSADLQLLRSTSRVSRLQAGFRAALERVIVPIQPAPSPGRSGRVAPAASPATAASTAAPPSEASTPQPTSQPPVQASPPLAAAAPPPVRTYAERTHDARVESGNRVRQLLENPAFVADLERVLLGRADPVPTASRAYHLSGGGRRNLLDEIEQRRADGRAERRRRHMMDPAPPPSTGGGGDDIGSVANLQLVAGASFELLLSIQRTLQQELGAALAATRGDDERDDEAAAAATPSAPASAGAGTGGDGRSHRLGACVICCEAEVNTVFYRCGHLCTCARCAMQLRRRRAKCPICRAPVRDVIQAFLACASPPDSADSPNNEGTWAIV